MKKSARIFSISFLLFLLITAHNAIYAQLPAHVLVGYHENWNTLKISQAHANYNVICLAFALPVNHPAVGYDLRYDLPAGYTTVAQMKTDIDLVHSQGKVVLLSIGGATGPVMLNSAAEQTTFENSLNAILTTYGNKIDGIDLDLETSSMNFGSWTITSPSATQTRLINAVKNVMANYQTVNGKKMILTMAPEVIYLMGGMSTYQVDNYNGGAFLPVLYGLRNELDLLHMQLYNAGGAGGGVYAWDGNLYYDNGTIDFALAMNESIIKGFTCVYGLGTFPGIPSSKIAFGLPATSSGSTAHTGYVTPANICNGVKYFRGAITKPAGVSYTMSSSYSDMKGLMTWSINEDNISVNGQWNFALGYPCTIPSTLPVVFSAFQLHKEENGIKISWQTVSEQNAKEFIIEKSLNGIAFYEAGRVNAHGNSGIAINYSFIDSEYSSEKIYYRIKEVDLDGTFQYTDIKSIQASLISVEVYPNPAADHFTLYSSEPAQAVLSNLTGNVLASYDFKYAHTFGEDLPAGVYLLRVMIEGEVRTIKIVKQ